MFWIIAIAVVGVIIYLISQNLNKNKNGYLKLFELCESHYQELQDVLREAMDRGYDKTSSLFSTKAEFKKERLKDRENFLMNELHRKHVITIQSSDQNTEKAKLKVTQSWFDYLLSFTTFYSYINSASMDTDSIESQGKEARDARSSLEATLEAYGYDSTKERKEIEDKLKKQD